MQTELNTYQQKLDENLKKVQESQKANGVNSCLKCEKVIGCEIRNLYVRIVYESMNGGQGGDFEF